jgi:hypothetical protein
MKERERDALKKLGWFNNSIGREYERSQEQKKKNAEYCAEINARRENDKREYEKTQPKKIQSQEKIKVL